MELNVEQTVRVRFREETFKEIEIVLGNLLSYHAQYVERTMPEAEFQGLRKQYLEWFERQATEIFKQGMAYVKGEGNAK